MTYNLRVIILFLIIRYGSSKILDNRLIENPKVTCGPNDLTIEAHSEDIFEGQVYIKNHRRSSSDCYATYSKANYSNTPKLSLPLSRISACGLEMQRDTSSKRLQLSAVIVFAFHPSFITAGDRAFAVQCLFHQGDYPVFTAFNLTENFHSIPVQGYAEYPTVELSIVKGKMADSVNDSPTDISIGQPLMLVWHLTNESMVYGIRVLYCTAQSKSGLSMQILNNDCSQDYGLVSDVRYSDEHNRAFADVTAFKFPDQAELKIRCHTKLCIKKFDHLQLGGANQQDLCQKAVTCDDKTSKSKRSTPWHLDDSTIVVEGQARNLDKKHYLSAKLDFNQFSESEDWTAHTTCLDYSISALISGISLSLYITTTVVVFIFICGKIKLTKFYL